VVKREEMPMLCPHCGRELSSWEQVLLSVDRALVCKGCWYRIVLDINQSATITKADTDKKTTSE
jgi:DNA-directed RNA polymerase subunit RPC12/RpoP